MVYECVGMPLATFLANNSWTSLRNCAMSNNQIKFNMDQVIPCMSRRKVSHIVDGMMLNISTSYISRVRFVSNVISYTNHSNTFTNGVIRVQRESERERNRPCSDKSYEIYRVRDICNKIDCT